MANSLGGVSVDEMIRQVYDGMTPHEQRALDFFVWASTLPFKPMTIQELFKGQEQALKDCLLSLSEGARPHEVAEHVIRPVLKELEANAGQDMDAGYIAWMVEYARTQSQP